MNVLRARQAAMPLFGVPSSVASSFVCLLRLLSTQPAGEESAVEQVRSRIFGTHIGDGLRSGRKVLRRPLVGAKLASYYPPLYFAGDPLLVDVDAERKKAKLQRLSRRGKAPPRKGAGKRSGKKN
jgi:small subunit ribosomal protein S33